MQPTINKVISPALIRSPGYLRGRHGTHLGNKGEKRELMTIYKEKKVEGKKELNQSIYQSIN